jgi:uncharacterized protein YndB with AHSA1/START domain
MQNIHFSILINATREKVWDTMLQDATYREWTSAFNPGSYYRGDWIKGSKMLFLGPNPDGSGEGGMVSSILENRPYEHISIEHQGLVKEGVEDTTSDEALHWASAHENYTFVERDGVTELTVDLDTPEEYAPMFQDMWPKALDVLKTLSEQGTSTKVTVAVAIDAPVSVVWECFTTPVHITKWNQASPDWHTPSATSDLRVGGRFCSRMEAVDGSAGFDFEGTYTVVEPHARLAYTTDDGRQVQVDFHEEGSATRVTETFDAEHENPVDMQRVGWQAILDAFKAYVEAREGSTE